MLRSWSGVGRLLFGTPVRAAVTIAIVVVVCLTGIKLILIAAVWQIIGALLVIAIPFVVLAVVLGWRPGK